MPKNRKQAQKRRAHRTEQRRVMQKQRKTEERALRSRPLLGGRLWSATDAGSDQVSMQLTDRMLVMLPASLREAAIGRCMKRIDAVTDGVGALPPGFELLGTPNGAWQVVPPPEHDLLIKAITHPARELAVAFAWEVARGEVDAVATRELARKVAATLIERGDVPAGSDPEVASKMLGLLIGAELLAGYMSMAAKFGGEMTLPR